jgi:hypothetical protein
VANTKHVETHRIESTSHSNKVVILIEREALRAGEPSKFSGRIAALRDIYATANRLALDIIEDIRRNNDKISKH